MKEVAEVWTAYRELSSRSNVTAEEKEAFWASLTAFFAAEAVAGLRRALEFFDAEELPELPADEPPDELRALWGVKEG